MKKTSIIRYFALALAALMLLPAAVSCTSGNGNETAGESGSADPAPTQTEEPTAAPTDAPTEAPTEPGTDAPQTPSIAGKKAIFIGNSFIYYGGVVTSGGQRNTDTGWFYQICLNNKEKLTVVDCTYGGHRLEDFTTSGCKTSGCDVGVGGDLLKGLDLSSFDYVFMSEAGENNSAVLPDLKNIMKRFTNPDVTFYYLCHTYSYTKSHTNITAALAAMKKIGIHVIDWGHLCYDVYQGTAKVPGAAQKYTKNTFVNSTSSDGHHPNPLAGYICAQMCYCAITGKSAVGQSYAMKNRINYGSGSVSFDKYTGKYYTSGTSNFTAVFDSAADMEGLQQLIDSYLAKWDLGVNGKLPKPIPVCEHTYDAGKVTVEPTAFQTGLKVYTCTKCGTQKEEILEKTNTRTNLARGAEAVIYSASKSSVGKPSLLTDGNTANNGSGNADAGYCSAGTKDSFGGKSPAEGTGKVSLKLSDGSNAQYWYVAQVKLGTAAQVDGIAVYEHGYKTTVMDGGFDLLVSADGATWTRVAQYARADLFTGPKDGKGYENYVNSTSAAASAEDLCAYIITDFAAVSGVQYVAYGCTEYRQINGYYTARFTEIEVYGK